MEGKLRKTPCDKLRLDLAQLKNLGNTCFGDAPLQMMYHLETVRDLVVQYHAASAKQDTGRTSATWLDTGYLSSSDPNESSTSGPQHVLDRADVS